METKIKSTSREDQKIASSSFLSLRRSANEIRKNKHFINIKLQEARKYVKIPKIALDMLVQILSNMAEGKSITIIPSDAEISTQQAAEMLNVSRPHLVKLLEEGEITFRKVGSHRRIFLKDLLHYERSLKDQRRKSLEKLSQQAQELKYGYK